ncbi:hypothetical protein EJ03DRAFT_274693 [Teratosphaeria nubilosa]|uniref:BTB domain-containing protein n=1 Tax=Teratosphaeria nubilosa TaxID=161662 RepID=A0A6G1L5K4_9PEZI|nr:hypothetical protein EJ03DRAFT_274693 [Teratosphaeria nubilosa]
MFDELVIITVGTDPQRTFRVYRGVISFYSRYFAAAFNNGRFQESIDMATTLPSEDPLIFQLFVHWIHTRRFYDSTLEPSVLLDCGTIAKLWVFGDAHGVPLLQNIVADIFARKMGGLVDGVEEEVVRYVEENTMEGSVLRRLLEVEGFEGVVLCPEFHVHQLGETCYEEEDAWKPDKWSVSHRRG